MAGRFIQQVISFTLLPAELRYGPAHTIGDVLVKGEHLWPLCDACWHVAVVHPAVIARIVGYDCRLADLRWRLKCRMCGAKHIRIGTAIPGEVKWSAAEGHQRGGPSSWRR